MAAESPLKIIKNVFYFIFKAIFVLKISNFCPDFLVMQENALIRKLRSISKFMTSQIGRKIIKMHLLPNILRIKGNKSMKFGQLVEHHGRNIFFSKTMQKMSQGD